MALRIEKPAAQVQKKSPLLPILALIILLIAAGGLWYWLTPKDAEPSTPLEISNFIGKPEFYSAARKTWGTASRGEKLTTNDKLRTAKEEEVDLKIPDLMVLRLKNSAVLESLPTRKSSKKVNLRLYLSKGSLFGATEKKFPNEAALEVFTPDSIIQINGGLFEVTVDPKTGQTWFGVLDGTSEIRKKSFLPSEITKLGSLQSISPQTEKSYKKVSRDEWDHLKEAYELIQRGAAHEAEQLDMAKKAGSLYDKVFDHGTFFTPKIGNAQRDFYVNEKTGETILNMAYDVFPRGSYVGMYMKTRNLDLVNFKNLEFEARIAPDQAGPAEFQVEIKSAGSVIRRLAAKQFTKDWKAFSFPLQVTKSAPVQEINFYFSHEKVGENSKGGVELRKINLIAEPNPPKPTVQPAAPAAAPKTGRVPKPDAIVAVPKVIKPAPKPEVLADEETARPKTQSKTVIQPVANADAFPDGF